MKLFARLKSIEHIRKFIKGHADMPHMSSFAGILHEFITSVAYLMKTDFSIAHKLKIIYTYFRFTILTFIFTPVKRETSFMGQKVSFFDFSTFKYLFLEIFFKNEYYFKTKKENPVIFDCGANIGMATLFFKSMYPNSTVYSFEADKTTFDVLKKNVERNCETGVFLYNHALSDENKIIDFYTDPADSGSLRMSACAGRVSGKKIKIDAISLADFMENELRGNQIDFLKMDIEGSEREVIFDLVKKDKLKLIKEGVIEYHHKIVDKKSDMASFLNMLELQGFEYQLSAYCNPISSKEKFQDILIYFYNPTLT